MGRLNSACFGETNMGTLSTLARGHIPLLKELAGLKSAIVEGAAAGNITITGIATADILAAVVKLGKHTTVSKVIDGGAAGNLTVTGIATTDRIVSVTRLGAAKLKMV